MKLLLYSLLILFSVHAGAQTAEDCTLLFELPHLPVTDQGSTGTCWSFATTSFLESEILRKGYRETDLSEMFFVYFAYQNKAESYFESNGQTNFGQGGQAHDVIDVVAEEGVILQDVFEGEMVRGQYVHGPLARKLTAHVDDLNENGGVVEVENDRDFNRVLRREIGRVPSRFKVEEARYTTAEFRHYLEINPADYVEITSYTDAPFYKTLMLDVPDNWSNDLYYNLPVDELIEVMLYSLNNGYTFCWDGDTSEKTFRNGDGYADLPEEHKGSVTQELRQETFENETTTDDHLMHVVGLSENSAGETCFYTKNSWGADSNDFGGYLHMTEDYVRLKTIAILVHKDAIPSEIREKLNL